jgi:hypothetical protein
MQLLAPEFANHDFRARETPLYAGGRIRQV